MKELLMKELSLKCSQYLLDAMTDNNKSKIELYNNIKEILNTASPFSHLDTEVTLNILYDLGYSKEDSIEIYKNLLS